MERFSDERRRAILKLHRDPNGANYNTRWTLEVYRSEGLTADTLRRWIAQESLVELLVQTSMDFLNVALDPAKLEGMSAAEASSSFARTIALVDRISKNKYFTTAHAESTKEAITRAWSKILDEHEQEKVGESRPIN